MSDDKLTVGRIEQLTVENRELLVENRELSFWRDQDQQHFQHATERIATLEARLARAVEALEDIQRQANQGATATHRATRDYFLGGFVSIGNRARSALEEISHDKA